MSNDPALQSSDAAFGPPTYNSDGGVTIGFSNDKKAFTANFGEIEVILDSNSYAPVVSRVVSFVLPLSNAAPDLEIPFNIAGDVGCENGAANGHLLVSINDQTSVFDFPGTSETDFTQHLKFKVGSATEVRVTIFLLADRDSKSNAGVRLRVQAIDADTASAQ